MKRFVITALQFLILISALIYAAPSRSETKDGIVIQNTNFTSNHWTNGLHLTAGLGVNSSYISNDFTRENLGLGLNIHTDVGYYFYNNFALEVSANVMLSRVKTVLIWDTSLTVGTRVRLPSYLGPDHSTPYIRLAGGRGPSVFIYKGEKPSEIQNVKDSDRFQVEGDIYSVAYGFFQDARDGTVWFLELQGQTHIYRKLEAIEEVKQVSEVVYAESVKDNAAMYSLSLTFGVVLL